MKTGVDVSSWQHPDGAAIDYELAVRSGVDFVIAELLDEEGPTPNPFTTTTTRDSRRRAPPGAPTCSCGPTTRSAPQIEALRSCSQLGPVWADLEVNDGDDAAQVKAFWLAIREGVPTCGLATYPAFSAGRISPPQRVCRSSSTSGASPTRPCRASCGG